MPKGFYKKTGLPLKPPSTKGINLTVEHKRKIALSKKGKPHLKGEKNPMWKGGVSPEHHRIRQSTEYKLWRAAVFERDKWTCVWCFKRGVKIQADHIKPFALFPELRFAIDNGRTLCIECHKKTDSWGVNIKSNEGRNLS